MSCRGAWLHAGRDLQLWLDGEKMDGHPPLGPFPLRLDEGLMARGGLPLARAAVIGLDEGPS